MVTWKPLIAKTGTSLHVVSRYRFCYSFVTVWSLFRAALDCGRSCARKSLVARGNLTYPGQFPWQAMLCYPPWGQYCGGVLVSPDCVVTAAHCVVRREIIPRDINVCLGRQCGDCSERDLEGSPQCSKPHSVAVHPQYDRFTLDNDIAVMKLRYPPYRIPRMFSE